MNVESEYLARCKRLIGEKLGFDRSGELLRQRDLEYLAETVERESGIRLSLSTLKRLWKRDYEQTPHPSTLSALVSVLGYKDWHDFKQGQTLDRTESSAEPAKVRRRMRAGWMILPASAILLVAFWLIAFTGREDSRKPVIKGPVIFKGNKTVTQGVPNTIIFNYDVTNVQADSFFFQQSWNQLEKTTIDPEGHYYSTIYYYPGFHRAKLIANDSIIMRFKAHITTDGWMPLVRYSYEDKLPLYIRKEHQVTDGALHVTQNDLVSSHVAMDKEFVLSYYNVREFEDTYSDNFSLETRIICDRSPTTACPGFEVVIMTEEHIFFVRLMGKGCERNIAIKMGEVVEDGSNNDLSAFGRDLYSWQHLRIEVQNKRATIYVGNDNHTIAFKQSFGKVVGLVYNFAGSGAVDYVQLRNGENRVVYEDQFGG